MSKVTSQVHCYCSKTFKTPQAMMQHMRNSPTHHPAPNREQTSGISKTPEGLQSQTRFTPPRTSNIARDVRKIKCFCGKMVNENGVENHLQNSSRHQKLLAFCAGANTDDGELLWSQEDDGGASSQNYAAELILSKYFANTIQVCKY